jgi:ATP-dependent Clp protease ATP-binding subunit ClpC
MDQRLLKNSTMKVAEALQAALMELANLRKTLVTADIVLLAVIEQKDSIANKIFEELKLNPAEIRAELADKLLARVHQLPEAPQGRVASLRISEDVQQLFDAAEKERKRLGDTFITTGALFLACFSAESTSTQLTDLSLSYQSCAAALDGIRGHAKVTTKDGESRQSLLEEYTSDVTALARRGKVDPVIGREDEIAQVIQILSRRKKNNPVLIGEPGVGKTVIVEGLAHRIIQGDVPEYLLNKRLLSLEMGSLIAGAKMQGEFEERLKKIMDEVIHSAGQIILFIDELHTVVGTGRTGGALDASNMLKPALARGLLQCMGATTLKEYKQYIEADKALERRFQPVKVEQPSIAQTIDILMGLRKHYEEHHKIKYTDESLRAAVEMSEKYIPDRFLPDKAIDMLDEAGSAKRLKLSYTQPEIRELEKKRQDLLDKKAQAFEDQDFPLMAQYQMELSEVESKLTQLQIERQKTLKEEDKCVDQEDIARLISQKTGIPVQKIAAQEAEKLLHLEQALKSFVIAQDHAIKSVSNAIRRNRAGLRKEDKPIASFLFLGPTGVGKTELAKAIAAEVLDDPSRMIRIDMSELMERHDVAKLIGSPPGYVGYGEGGILTEQVRQKPYAVVLFDEIEKAHPDVFNILLQVLDEGWLTDGEGRKVSFRNCVIVGTSNLGSEILMEKRKPVGLGAQSVEDNENTEKDQIMAEVRRFLKPEFINRLDEIIIFKRLTKEDFHSILNLHLAELTERLRKMSVEIDISQEAKDWIIGSIDTTNFGARPLKRKVQEVIENEVANLLITKTEEKLKIKVGLEEGKATVKKIP